MNKLLTLYPNLKTAENTPLTESFLFRNKFASYLCDLITKHEDVYKKYDCNILEVHDMFKILLEFRALFLTEGSVTEENFEKFKTFLSKASCCIFSITQNKEMPGYTGVVTLCKFINTWWLNFMSNLDYYTCLSSCEKYWDEFVTKKQKTKKHANWIPSVEEIQTYWDEQVYFAEGVINNRLYYTRVFIQKIQKYIEIVPVKFDAQLAKFYKAKSKVEAKAELKGEFEVEIREGCEAELKDESEGEPESTPESTPLPKVEPEEKTPLQQKQERFEYLDLRVKAFIICFNDIFTDKLCLEAYQIITAIKKESYTVNNNWDSWYHGIENIIELFRLRECEFKHWNNATFDIVDCFLKKIFISENHSKIDELILELKLELKHSCYLVDKFEEVFKIYKDNLRDWAVLNKELHPEVKEVPVNPFEELINGPSK